MKPTTLLLLASLVANAALVFVLTTRSSSKPAASTSSARPTAAAPAGTREAELRAALASGDAAALEAAGVPADLARELVLGRAFARLAERMRAIQGKAAGDERWWRNRPGLPGSREQQLLARRELAEALTAAFGDDFGLGGGDPSQLSFLSAAKRDALRRINQDYDEMFAKFSAGGVQLPSDREKLRLLRAERDRDIAALLTPDERLAYDMRTSSTAAQVRARYGDAIASEEEFRRIYELQRGFDDKFSREMMSGRVSPETMRARADAERQLEADVRAAVGDDRYAALRRAADPELRTLDALTSRLNLPSTATDRVLSARDTFAAQSQQIMNDASLSMPDRRAQIQQLGARAKSDLATTLGSEGAEAYAQRSPWISMLQGGTAFSTTPPAGLSSLPAGMGSVYPVMPAGAPGSATTRQVIVNPAPIFDTPVAGAFVGGDVVGAVPGNVQVMTFTTSSSNTTDPATAGTSQRRVMVNPGTTAPAAPPPQPPPATRP